MAQYGYGSADGKVGSDAPNYYSQQTQQPNSPGAAAGAYHAQGAPVYGAPEGQGGYGGGSAAAPMVVDGVPLYPDHPDPTIRKKFVTSGYRDVWAAALFLIALLVTLIVSIYNGHKIASEPDYDSTTPVPVPGATVTPVPTYSQSDRTTSKKLQMYIPAAGAASVGLACVALLMMRLFAKQYIVAANVLVIVLNVAMAIYFVSKKVYYLAVLYVIFAALNGLWLFLVRKRIPFAGVLLSTSVTTVTRHWGCIVTSFGALAATVIYVVMWVFMALPTLKGIENANSDEYGGHSNKSGLHYFATCMFLLLFLWATQVIVNVSHVTTSGTVATWYFVGGGNMPINPSVASLKRAMTTSFGSICFGSLVVAILKLIYYMVRSATRNSNSFLACIAVCLLGILQRLMEYFNVYAFTHVAIYGTSYIDAAKQTWEMIKQCGFSAYFNDCLVWPVLTLTTFFGSLAIGLVFGFASESLAVGIVAFIVSFVIMTLLFRPVYSGIVTVFVCVAECPDVMNQANPEFAAAIAEAERVANEPVC